MGQCDQLVFFPAEDPFGLRKYKAYYRKGGRLLYCARRDESSTVEGLHSVYIQDYFPRMLVRRALQQLDEYLETNWANTEMYQYDAFWRTPCIMRGVLSYQKRFMFWIPGWMRGMCTSMPEIALQKNAFAVMT